MAWRDQEIRWKKTAPLVPAIRGKLGGRKYIPSERVGSVASRLINYLNTGAHHSPGANECE
jgi:hypothetical protein